MTPTLRNPMFTIATVGAVFAVALVVLMLVNRSATPTAGSGGGEDVSSAISTGSAQVSDLQDVVDSGEAGPAVYAALGNALLDQLREHGRHHANRRRRDGVHRGARPRPQEPGGHRRAR